MTSNRPHVVVVGAGFAGLSCVRALAKVDVDITLVDRHNYHLFQPLLYQVATAGLSPAEIAWPIRRLVRNQANVSVRLDSVVGVDNGDQRVMLQSGTDLAYDYLVLATGARHAYFGNDHWAKYAPGLKSVDDATMIRRRILLAFEQAEMAPAEAQPRWLTVVVVGAGPTGVELAGTIAELAHKTLARDFRKIDPRSTRIVLVEAGDRVLSAMPPDLSEKALKSLNKLGVEVRLGTPITACDAEGVMIGDERLPAATVLWAAGVAASPAGQWLGVECDRVGRVQVEPDFSVARCKDVFAIGDAAALNVDGEPLPGIAPAAKQAGAYVGRAIAARLSGKDLAPFKYRDSGNLATIGRRSAVIDFGRIKLSGWVAWWGWGIAHIYFLIGTKSRLLVALQWFWSYITFDRGARLITGRQNIAESLKEE